MGDHWTVHGDIKGLGQSWSTGRQLYGQRNRDATNKTDSYSLSEVLRVLCLLPVLLHVGFQLIHFGTLGRMGGGRGRGGGGT